MDTDSVVCFEGAFIELQSDSGQISVSEKGLNGGTWSYSLTVARSVCLKRGWMEVPEVTVWQWSDQCVWKGVEWRYLKPCRGMCEMYFMHLQKQEGA